MSGDQKYASTSLSEWQGHKVEKVEISSLRAASWRRADIFYRVKDSIEKDGLKNPLVATRMKVKDYLERAKSRTLLSLPKNLDPEEMLTVVAVGCNRLSALRELGYTHVDIVVLPDLDSAGELGGVSRVGFEDIHKSC